MTEVMEIMREEVVEVLGLGEVENCGLEVRERRSLRCHENNGNGGVIEDNIETLAEDREGDDEGDWSVYFDQDEGSGFNSSDQIVATNSETADQFVTEKRLQNGQSEFEAKELNGHADFSLKSHSQTLMKMNMDDGSKVHLCSETKTETGALKTEIVEKVEHESKLQVTEFDVERVLEEQETHDLYCPNCNSCITKRVILRKRKRTGQGFKYDIKHKKVQETQNDLDVSGALTEIADEDRDREREVFRCLSCFSFFIPTEGGFNIFGIFGKREEDKFLTEPQEIPARNRSWSSIFGTMTGKKKENRAGFSLPGESSSGAGKQVEDAPRKELDDTKTDSELKPGEGQGLSEQKVNSKEGRSDAPLMYIPGSEVHGVQIIIGEKVDGPNNNKMSGKAFSEGPEANSDKGKSDTHLIDIPVYEVHGIQIIHGEKVNDPIDDKASGDDIIPSAEDIVAKPIGQTDGEVITHGGPHLPVSVPPEPIAEPRDDTQISIGDQGTREGTRNEWDVLKSIVYGGLIESITSLGVVSSAAGSDASTLNIVALGLANLIGGLFVIIHDLLNLQGEQHGTSRNKEEPAGRYWEQLGRRDNFRLHATVAVISYLIFGLLPPAIYGFSFMKSDNKEYKLIAIAAASLLCIALLAIGKAYVRLEKDYFKCLSYYIGLGVTASGLSYVAGVMIHRFLEELHLFDPESNVPAPPFDGSLLSGSKSPFLSSF
ncbi:hypothetical protein J5N97_024698 [Dioscorea zingiberensis]|uniref:Membrane protein of ER body-like protein n=1 Tax=Dioscorea zingiberensis TaxID=325984 RepID=A0A9D5C6Z2_9LILI|nr:hypothetical protein J5N97_024698 [Dioscorea zingiberensis]